MLYFAVQPLTPLELRQKNPGQAVVIVAFRVTVVGHETFSDETHFYNLVVQLHFCANECLKRLLEQ